MGAVESSRAGIASGVNNAVSRTASLLAIAIFGIVVAGAFERSLEDRISDLNLPPDVRAAVTAEEDRLAAADAPEGLNADTTAAVNDAYDRAFLSGFRLAMIVAAAMAALSALAAWWLVEGKTADPDPGAVS